jgi:transformation/transcription domain-associated protein
VSLEDVLEHFCTNRASPVDPEEAIMAAYRARVEEARRLLAAGGGELSKTFKKDVFDRIRRQQVPSDVLSRYLATTFLDHTSNWAFKRQFTSQLALAGLATHVLLLNKGAPHTFRFDLTTGNIIPWELSPSLNNEGSLVSTDRVPFRLTPNLVNFVTPAGITGTFSGAMVAVVQALNNPEMRVNNLLGAMMRDELIAWYSIYTKPFDKASVNNTLLLPRVSNNVNLILKRLVYLAKYSEEHMHTPVDQLIKAATASMYLACMHGTWQPWL